MAIPKVSLGFANLSDAELDAFTENVIKSLTGNPSYSTPTPPLVAITAALTTFTTALSAAADGGKQATAAKNEARTTLLTVLRQSASYVQGACQNDLAKLLSSGFDAIDTNRSQTELPTPVLLAITNGNSTTLTLNVQPVSNAKAYEVRHSSATNVWVPGGVFTQARKIVVENLTPGTTYTFQVRAVGGTTGYSGWSDPVSHMST
jgi:hypothetical protein